MAHEAARPATTDDVAAMAVLCREAVDELRPQRGGALWIAQYARHEPLEATLVADLADEAHLVAVGTIDDAIVGYACVRDQSLTHGGRLGVIEELFVHPEARGVGVGEALMVQIVAWASTRQLIGIDAVALPGSRHTKNFFESFGLVARAIVVHRALDPADPTDLDGHDH